LTQYLNSLNILNMEIIRKEVNSMSANTTVMVPREFKEEYESLDYPLELTKAEFAAFVRNSVKKGLEETRMQIARLKKKSA
jgi:hypothetical protein